MIELRNGLHGVRVLILILFLGAVGQAAITFIPHGEQDEPRRDWAFEIGVTVITANNVEQFMAGEFSAPGRAAGGEVYVLTASRRLGELRWEIGGHTFHPQMELPFTLEIVDENGRAPFLDFNLSFMMRWVDFPWNHHVKTSVAMGVGLSYSEKVYLMDIERHPNDNRSHLKFGWPIQVTFSSPDHPDHQLMLFLAHQSGGRVFDRGGVNSVGIGYRRGF